VLVNADGTVYKLQMVFAFANAWPDARYRTLIIADLMERDSPYSTSCRRKLVESPGFGPIL